MKTYTISKSNIQKLELHRIKYLNYWLHKSRHAGHPEHINTVLDGEHYYLKPLMFMLGGYKNHIEQIIPLEHVKDSSVSCGILSHVRSDEMAKGLCKIEKQFLGIGRIGAFHTRKRGSIGHGTEFLYRHNPNMIMLSLGRDGVLLEKLASCADTINKLNLEIGE